MNTTIIHWYSTQRGTGETEYVGGKVEDRKADEEDKVNEHERRDSFTPVPKTSTVVHVRQRETGETECFGGKAEERKGEDKVNVHERRDSFTPVPETSAVEPVCRHKTEDKGAGREKMKVEDRCIQRIRKPTEIKTDRSKPARKGPDSVKNDQPIPIFLNTNPIESRSNRNPIGRDQSGKRSRLMKTRKRPGKDTTTDDKGQEYEEREQRIWWIRCRQWFGWKEWTYSKWRDSRHSGRNGG